MVKYDDENIEKISYINTDVRFVHFILTFIDKTYYLTLIQRLLYKKKWGKKKHLLTDFRCYKLNNNNTPSTERKIHLFLDFEIDR